MRVSVTKRAFLPLAAAAMATVLAGCGSQIADPASAGSAASSGTSCVNTSGSSIKVGFINSLSGTMAISESTVFDSLTLAAEEINASGGVLGKKLDIISEDGASEPDPAE